MKKHDLVTTDLVRQKPLAKSIEEGGIHCAHTITIC